MVTLIYIICKQKIRECATWTANFLSLSTQHLTMQTNYKNIFVQKDRMQFQSK